jgi:acetyltransferase
MTTDIAPVRPLREGVPGVRFREARPDDDAALQRMFLRCGPDSRYGRFHGVVHEIPARYLREALTADPAVHDAVVIELPRRGGELIALGSAAGVHDPAGWAVEVGLLVHDDWQHRGLGSWLLAVLAARARYRGAELLRCDVLARDTHLLDVVRRTVGPLTVRREGAEVLAEARLR